MYILNSRPDRKIHPVYQVFFFVHNPQAGPAQVKALDHILCFLAGTDNLCY